MSQTQTQTQTLTQTPTQVSRTTLGRNKPKVVTRTARIRDKTGGRVVTMAYEHNLETNVLKYGATIFRREAPTAQFDKKGHRETAHDRLKKHPVVLENFVDKYGSVNEKGSRKGKNYNLKDLHNDIRREVYTHGVRDKTGQTTTQ